MNFLVECPVCGLKDSEIVASLNDENIQRYLEFDKLKYGGLFETWLPEIKPEISRCKICNHCWYRYQPDPVQLSRMYDSGVPLSKKSEVGFDQQLLIRRELEKFRGMLRGASQLTLLDYGAGSGKWSEESVHLGFDVTAFEPSSERATLVGRSYRTINDLSEVEGEKFSAILLEQVLEHLPNPLQALEQ